MKSPTKKWLLIILTQFVFTLSACNEKKLSTDKELETKISKKYTTLTKKFSCPAISANELKKKLQNENVVLVDIRDEKEIEVSRIPGAITEQQFKKNIDQYKGKTIVAYCTIGYRSGKFASEQKIPVHNLIGGVLMWSHSNGEFVNKKGKTDKVHVYSKDWNYLNSKYKAITK